MYQGLFDMLKTIVSNSHFGKRRIAREMITFRSHVGAEIASSCLRFAHPAEAIEGRDRLLVDWPKTNPTLYWIGNNIVVLLIVVIMVVTLIVVIIVIIVIVVLFVMVAVKKY